MYFGSLRGIYFWIIEQSLTIKYDLIVGKGFIRDYNFN